ncbi:MAG: Hsp70 family protein [Rivularia sp. (in: cyanobacteria)]
MSEVDILGIDLGTTNSAVAIWEVETEQARILSNSEGDRLTPSVVMFDTQSNQPIVGKLALSCINAHPGQVIYSVKRFIGCTFRDQRVREDQSQVTYTIEELQQSKVAVRVGEQILTPPQISAQVLRQLKEDAEASLGKQFSKAVITVPAYFSESQRQATKEAAELAGLRVPRIVWVQNLKMWQYMTLVVVLLMFQFCGLNEVCFELKPLMVILTWVVMILTQ